MERVSVGSGTNYFLQGVTVKEDWRTAAPTGDFAHVSRERMVAPARNAGGSPSVTRQ